MCIAAGHRWSPAERFTQTFLYSNQPIHQPNQQNQSINQSTNQPTHPVSQSANQPINTFVNHSVDLRNKSANQSIDQPTNQHTIQSINHSINQHMNSSRKYLEMTQGTIECRFLFGKLPLVWEWKPLFAGAAEQQRPITRKRR